VSYTWKASDTAGTVGSVGIVELLGKRKDLPRSREVCAFRRSVSGATR